MALASVMTYYWHLDMTFQLELSGVSACVNISNELHIQINAFLKNLLAHGDPGAPETQRP